MPDPTRPSREAREAAARLWLRLPDYHRLDRRAEVDIARALDDFAEKWREEAERRQGRWNHLRHHLSTGGRVVGKALDSVLMAVMAITQERDALRREVSDLQRRVDHCECESLIDHVRDCLPEYEHDDNVHGESEPFNEIETIEEAGREIDALRRRVAELKDVCVPCKRPAVYCICKLEHDVLVAEGRAEAAEKALAAVRQNEWNSYSWNKGRRFCSTCDEFQGDKHKSWCHFAVFNEEARRARGET